MNLPKSVKNPNPFGKKLVQGRGKPWTSCPLFCGAGRGPVRWAEEMEGLPFRLRVHFVLVSKPKTTRTWADPPPDSEPSTDLTPGPGL